MKNYEANPSKNYERLRTLYAVSKLLSNFESVENSFPEILTATSVSFPLLTAVLIEDWENFPKTTIWQSADATVDQVDKAILHARNAYIYISGASAIQSADINAKMSPSIILRRNSNTVTSNLDSYGNYIVLPLVVLTLPPHGALQLEGAVPLDEADLEFVGALADLICVTLDRYYKTKREMDFIKNEVRVKAEKLSVSKEEVSDLESERQSREAFVSLLTHDLRTPLTSALMSAQLIEKKKYDPEMCVLLAKRIGVSINRIGQMISNLLDANLIRSGEHLPLNLEVFNLHALVKITLDELVTIHGNRFLLQGSEKIEGYWDKKGMRRIIENLCNNAIKYGSNQSPVTVYIVQNHELAQIRVHNIGEVISLIDQKSLFDQFRRSETAHNSRKKGWGLGLSLVRGVAEAHGGMVSVESNVDIGTVFTVTLPLMLQALASPD